MTETTTLFHSPIAIDHDFLFGNRTNQRVKSGPRKSHRASSVRDSVKRLCAWHTGELDNIIMRHIYSIISGYEMSLHDLCMWWWSCSSAATAFAQNLNSRGSCVCDYRPMSHTYYFFFIV